MERKTTTRTDEIIDRLREMVLEGFFPAGAHLQEVSLANALGVSRTPIRDALRILGQEQLLTYSPNRGYFVSAMPAKQILDAYDMRATLEGMGCRICAEQGLPEEMLAQLHEIVRESEEIFVGGRDEAEWGPLNTQFHLLLVEASGNQHLLNAAKQMRRIPRLFDSRLQPNAEFFRSVYTMERRRQSLLEHQSILDAIVAGQSGRAEHLMREHVYRNREALRRKLETLEADDPVHLDPAAAPASARIREEAVKPVNGAAVRKRAGSRLS